MSDKHARELAEGDPPLDRRELTVLRRSNRQQDSRCLFATAHGAAVARRCCAPRRIAPPSARNHFQATTRTIWLGALARAASFAGFAHADEGAAFGASFGFALQHEFGARSGTHGWNLSV
jgi:hypothetical protein